MQIVPGIARRSVVILPPIVQLADRLPHITGLIAEIDQGDIEDLSTGQKA